MNSNRLFRQRIHSLKPHILFLLIVVIGFIVWFIPPKHLGIILIVIAGIGVVAYLASSYFFSKKRQVIITSFIVLTLCMSYLLGFHVLNTLLLLSFIIVVAKLFSK